MREHPLPPFSLSLSGDMDNCSSFIDLLTPSIPSFSPRPLFKLPAMTTSPSSSSLLPLPLPPLHSLPSLLSIPLRHLPIPIHHLTSPPHPLPLYHLSNLPPPSIPPPSIPPPSSLSKNPSASPSPQTTSPPPPKFSHPSHLKTKPLYFSLILHFQRFRVAYMYLSFPARFRVREGGRRRAGDWRMENGDCECEAF